MNSSTNTPQQPYAYLRNIGAAYSEAELLFLHSDFALDDIIPYPEAFSWRVQKRSIIAQYGYASVVEQMDNIQDAVSTNPSADLLSSDLGEMYRHYLGTPIEPIIASALEEEQLWVFANEHAHADSILSIIEPGTLLVMDNDSSDRPSFCAWLRRALQYSESNHNYFSVYAERSGDSL